MKLSDISRGIKQQPPRVLLHAVHGLGKSTWGANAPDPIFIQTEDGLGNIDVPAFPLATDLKQVWDAIGALIQEDHKYKTVVIDTVDWLQTLIWKQVCTDKDVASIEEIGYAKGYLFAMTYWEQFLRGMDKLRSDKGMAIVLLAHSEIKAFNPPDGESYDRYQIKLNKHAASRLEEWADVVLFANFETYTDKDKKVVNNDPVRVIHTTNRPAWRAKTRYKLPDTLPLDFSSLLTAIKKKGA